MSWQQVTSGDPRSWGTPQPLNRRATTNPPVWTARRTRRLLSSSCMSVHMFVD
ncbi:hypothetical protein M3J09_008941 [Ascochyta lentis]